MSRSTTTTPHRRLRERRARLQSRYGQGCPFLPDAVKDTTRKRRRRAAALLGDGCGPFSRLYALRGGRLYHLTVRYHVDWDFYLDAPSQIKLSLERLLGKAPRYVFAAWSKAGIIHAHVLVHLKAQPDAWNTTPEESAHIVSINDDQHFLNLSEYFGRPHDERSERVKPHDLHLYTPDALWLMRLDAAEDYLAARERHGGRRLPALSWSSYIPTLRPDSRDYRVDYSTIQQRLATQRGKRSSPRLLTSTAQPAQVIAKEVTCAPALSRAQQRARAPPGLRATSRLNAASLPRYTFAEFAKATAIHLRAPKRL